MADASGGTPVSRRDLLRHGAVGLAGIALSADRLRAIEQHAPSAHAGSPHAPGNAATQGVLRNAPVDPHAFLEHFDYGEVTGLPDGWTLREYRLSAVDREVEIAPGVTYPAWTYNGQVPGPTLRATRRGSPAHSLHQRRLARAHHPLPRDPRAARMDGVFEVVHPGESFTYEFTARPFGLHLYHCHAIPLKRHIAKGLYGAFIVDPATPRPAAREMVMVLNGYRHELRWRERDLRRQHGAIRLPPPADHGAAGRAAAPLHGEHPRVRPAQLDAPARQLLPRWNMSWWASILTTTSLHFWRRNSPNQWGRISLWGSMITVFIPPMESSTGENRLEPEYMQTPRETGPFCFQLKVPHY